MNPVSKFFFELQELSMLVWRVLVGIKRGPRYWTETIHQMDEIGVGSLIIIILTGFFTGGVLILQAYPTLAFYGAQSQAGQGVATTLVRELGPVLSALMVAGRVGSAISAELGSMVVSQQIDAMRALGTSPVRKLVTPRVVALLISMPLLTVASDIFGIIGGGLIARQIYGLDTTVYSSSVRAGIDIDDVIGGILKPLIFGLIIGLISCHRGLSTTGGTVGVGKSTTNAVVTSSICVIIADFFLSKMLQTLFNTTLF
jgi:phospholipid/cholesterol/gamma-HCH transport system permease protein